MFPCCNYHYVLYSQVVKTCDVLLNCVSILFERVGLTSVLALRTGSLPRLQCFMFQPYWDLIDLEHCVSWRCLTGDWIHIYCGMITVDVWVNTSISSWTTICCFLMRAFKIYRLSNSLAYSAALKSPCCTWPPRTSSSYNDTLVPFDQQLPMMSPKFKSIVLKPEVSYWPLGSVLPFLQYLRMGPLVRRRNQVWSLICFAGWQSTSSITTSKA